VTPIVFTLVTASLVVSLALYAGIVFSMTRYKTAWVTRIVRPVLLMLVLAPGLVAGHGIAVLPVGIALYHDAPQYGLDSDIVRVHLGTWLGFAAAAFGLECAVAARRSRRPEPRPEF
jgi:hypothetical protein